MADIHKLQQARTADPADLVADLIARPGTPRYARVALRVAHAFMVGSPYGDDLPSAANDVRILAARLANRTRRVRRMVDALERVAGDLEE